MSVGRTLELMHSQADRRTHGRVGQNDGQVVCTFSFGVLFLVTSHVMIILNGVGGKLWKPFFIIEILFVGRLLVSFCNCELFFSVFGGF